MKRGDFGLMLGRIPYSESGGALQQAAQRSRGCSIPGEVQGQAGWGPEKPELVGGNQPMIGGWNWVIFKVPSNPKPFCDSRIDSMIVWNEMRCSFLLDIGATSCPTLQVSPVGMHSGNA